MIFSDVIYQQPQTGPAELYEFQLIYTEFSGDQPKFLTHLPRCNLLYSGKVCKSVVKKFTKLKITAAIHSTRIFKYVINQNWNQCLMAMNPQLNPPTIGAYLQLWKRENVILFLI